MQSCSGFIYVNRRTIKNILIFSAPVFLFQLIISSKNLHFLGFHMGNLCKMVLFQDQTNKQF